MNQVDQAVEVSAIQVIYEDDESQYADSKGLGDSYDYLRRKIGSLNVGMFKERLQEMCTQLGEAVRSVETPGSDFSLDSFEVTLDVSAKGEVRLVGSVGSEVKGGVKLVFKKSR